MDKCTHDEQEALQDEVWRETCKPCYALFDDDTMLNVSYSGRDTALFVQSSWRKALTPTSFSPLQ